jgi:hypothetical protein
MPERGKSSTKIECVGAVLCGKLTFETSGTFF